MNPGDLVVFKHKGGVVQAALYGNDPNTPPHFRKAWIHPEEAFLVVGRTTFHGFGAASEWIEVAGSTGCGWVHTHGFEVIGEEEK